MNNCKSCSNPTENADGVCDNCIEKKPKNKKSGFSVLIILLLAIFIALVGFLLVKKFDLLPGLTSATSGEVLEKPFLYFNSSDELKIITSEMPAPVLLGNQGFRKEALLKPFALSEDNQKIAYITELGALFVSPVEESKAGIISSDYLVSEKALEVLGFAPDNNNVVYFIDDLEQLARYDGKKVEVISSAFYSDKDKIGLSIFSSANNDRIIYYEYDDGSLKLCTQQVGKAGTLKEFSDAFSEGIYDKEDEGFFYYENRGNFETDGLFLNYLNFETGEIKELGFAKDLHSIISVDGKGSMVVLQNIAQQAPETTTETPEAEASLPEATTDNTNDGSQTPATEQPATPENEGISADGVSATGTDYTVSLLSAETTVTEEEPASSPEGESPEAQVKEIEIDETQSQVPEEVEQLSEEEIMALMQQQAPQTFNVVIFASGEPLVVAENINTPVYSDLNGEYIIYSTTKENTITFYYQKITDGQYHEPHELFSQDREANIEFAQSDTTNSFAVSNLNEDGETTTITQYNLDENGNVVGEEKITESAFSLLNYTVDGAYMITQNIEQKQMTDGYLYSADLFTYKNGEYTEVQKGIEHFSVGKSMGTEQHGSELIFISNVEEKDGDVFGELNLYDGETVKTVATNFTVPTPESMLPAVFVNKDFIYYLQYETLESMNMDLYSYNGVDENKKLDSNITLPVY